MARPHAGGARAASAAYRIAAGLLCLLPGACEELVGPIDVDGAPIEYAEPLKGSPGAPECGDAGAPCPSSGCQPMEYSCQGTVLQRCNASGTIWELFDQCASDALCSPELGACIPAACGRGEHRCTETGELLRCSSDLTHFEQAAVCRSQAFCSAQAGREGCEQTACRAGRQRCNGPQIEQCRADRRGFEVVGEPCASAALCIEGESEKARCAQAACALGGFQCVGASLERCADELDRFVPLTSCETPELCNQALGRCEPPACEAGKRQCQGSLLQICNPGRTGFVTELDCVLPALCDASSPACLAVPPPPPVLGTDPYTFVSATGPGALGLGPMVLELPSQWADIDTRPWTSPTGETLGPLYIASTDAARFATSFDIPGVYFGATAVAPLDVVAMQARFDMSARCTRGALESYRDQLYAGTAQTWTGCGATNATNVVVAAIPDDKDYVAVVIVTILADRDRVAMDRIWRTFIAE